MDDRTLSLCKIDEDIFSKECELMLLREQCVLLEEKVYGVLTTLDEEKRETVEEYIRIRDDLEVLMINKAIRFGKRSASGGENLINNVEERYRQWKNGK